MQNPTHEDKRRLLQYLEIQVIVDRGRYRIAGLVEAEGEIRPLTRAVIATDSVML